MKKIKLPMQSAKFRRDYMAMFAFLLFFGIVVGEIMLALAIPWHFRLHSIWSTQIAQQEMINYFDSLRRSIRHESEKMVKPTSDEAELMCRTLDRMAPYLHRYSEQLEPAECRVLTDAFHRIGNHAYTLFKKNARPLSAEISFTPKGYLSRLRGKANAPAAPVKK